MASIPDDAPRQKSKWTDIATVILTFAILVTAIVSGFIFYGQLVESRNLTKRQFRAYLLYESGRVDISKDEKTYTVYIEVKNSGQGPAFTVTHWFNAKAMDRLPDPFESFSLAKSKFQVEDTGRESTDVGSGQSMCITRQFPVAHTELSGPNTVIYVWGIVKFRDQFQRAQMEAFALQSTSRIMNGKSLKLATVVHHTNDQDNPFYKGKEKAEGPWPEVSQSPAPPQSVIFQGTCPN